jgi:hypothetical protein
VQVERKRPVAVVCRQRREHVERRTQRVLDMVLGRTRRTEHGHDLVADELVDRAAIAFDHGHQPVEKPVDDVNDRFRIEPLRHLGETGDVGE